MQHLQRHINISKIVYTSQLRGSLSRCIILSQRDKFSIFLQYIYGSITYRMEGHGEYIRWFIFSTFFAIELLSKLIVYQPNTNIVVIGICALSDLYYDAFH